MSRQTGEVGDPAYESFESGEVPAGSRRLFNLLGCLRRVMVSVVGGGGNCRVTGTE